MTYKGRIHNGVVVLEEPVELEEGTLVRVEVLANAPGRAESVSRTLAERLAPVIGKAETLPPDASAQHDHYLYTTPKK
ncbi:MAG: hypothetical protein AMXMBFR82_10810 [Candidatus Hydrogenedentota bacterium]